MTRQRPIVGGRSPENLALVFRDFGTYEAPQLNAHLYEALCPRIATNADLQDVVKVVPASQPPPNLLFGAVHYLLLDGRDDALREFYRDLGGAADPAGAFPRFRAFVLEHREAIEEILRTRRVQTNVIQRCTALLPAFGYVAERSSEAALALVEIGPSAGLNLLWDRYGYRFERDGDAVQTWGDPGSGVQLPAELRGDLDVLALPASIEVASRIGIEYDPIDIEDDDAVRWLRALIWPEHVERHERLAAAIEIARGDPPHVIAGDATQRLASVLADAPRAAALCVYATHALYQIAREGRQRIFGALAEASAGRVVWFVSMEGGADGHSELLVHRYEDGERTVVHLANCNPHGRWIEWLGPRPGK